MKNKITNKLLKRLLIFAFIIYFVYTLIMQQKTLNSYYAEETKFNNDIEVAQDYQNELQSMKDNISSDEYIEQIAREKLGMYYPNEKVYIDIKK